VPLRLMASLIFPLAYVGLLTSVPWLVPALSCAVLSNVQWPTRPVVISAEANAGLTVKGRKYLEDLARQIVVIGEMDYEAVPDAARYDLTKAADRYKNGDLSGALAAACGAVDTACARIYEEKGLGDPAKAQSFQQKVISSLRANGAFKRLETE
jgi:hypothetical protein